MIGPEEQHVDSADGIEIAELIDEFSNPFRRSPTEDGFETPLAVVQVVGRLDDRLELVLDSVEFADDERVFVVEGERGDGSALQRFETRVPLGVLLDRLTNGAGARFQPFVLPRFVERIEYLAWNVEARSHWDGSGGVRHERHYYGIGGSAITTPINRCSGSVRMTNGLVGLALGASALGLLHGLAPGHGWAIAASYALDKPNKWFYGAASSLILGVGHLVSSIAMVLLYFFALSYFDLTRIGWMNYVAGALLIGLGIRQYFAGHEHTAGGHDGDPGEERDDRDHGHDHDGPHSYDRSHDHAHTDAESASRFARLRQALPFVGEADHSHPHGPVEEGSDRGLYGMAALAFALGFAHNEEFDIIAICTGSAYCLELMLLYAVSVIVSLVGVTLLLVAGYERYEDRLERYTEYLPTVTAAILVAMGIGFVVGVF